MFLPARFAQCAFISLVSLHEYSHVMWVVLAFFELWNVSLWRCIPALALYVPLALGCAFTNHSQKADVGFALASENMSMPANEQKETFR